MNREIYVDDRWAGNHGIGRYATEVMKRLEVQWKPLGFGGAPSSPTDAFRRIPGGAQDGLIYSPGYNGFLRGGRQVLTVHDLIHLQVGGLASLKFEAYYSTVVRPAVRRSRMVITDSQTSIDVLEKWLRDDRVEIVNASVGCSDAFQPDGEMAAFDRPTLIYVGNMRKHKNLATVLAALLKVPDVQLKVVLPARETEEATRAIREIGVEGQVELLSGVSDDDLAKMYRGALATVMPSTLEGFGLPPLESIRCGTPVLWWQGCEVIGETVEDRGIPVDAAFEPDAWAAAISDLADAPRKVEPPSADRYSWTRTAAIVSDALRRTRDA